MKGEDLKIRSKKNALEIIKPADKLPNNKVGWVFSDQIVGHQTQ